MASPADPSSESFPHSFSDEEATFDNYAFVQCLYSTYVSGVANLSTLNPITYIGCETPASYLMHRVLRDGDDTSLAMCRKHLAKALTGAELDSGSDDADDVLGAVALVEVAEEVLALSLRRSFSAMQVQQLLILFQRTLGDVTSVRYRESAAEEESELEGWIAAALAKRLGALAAKSSRQLAEKTFRVESVTEEVLDTALIATLESKKDAKANKKQIQAIDEAIRTLPKLKVERKVTREVEELVEIEIDPYFSFADSAHILDFFAQSLFANWRLFRFNAVEPRERSDYYFNVPVVDTYPCFIPPLSSSMSETDHTIYLARVAFWVNTESVLRKCFNDYFIVPMASLQEGRDKENAEHEQTLRDQEQKDRDEQLSEAEFHKTLSVLTHRAVKVVASNQVLIPKAPPKESKDAPPAAAPAAAAATKESADATPSATPRATTVLTAFAVDDIEARISRLAEAVGGRDLAKTEPAKKK